MPIHLENETALLNLARQGNRDAFTTLLKQYDHKISRLTLKITRDPDEAADALQDTFLKAYANLALFRGHSRFYTWLARIAVNEALTRLRRQNTNRHASLDDEVTPYLVRDRRHDPEQAYARSEMRDIVSGAIEALDPGLQRVLLLRYLEELSSEEIAAEMGLSVPAVKSRLMRARTRLRRSLSACLGADPAPGCGPPWRLAA